jgi:arginine decarboxylase-like protein
MDTIQAISEAISQVSQQIGKLRESTERSEALCSILHTHLAQQREALNVATRAVQDASRLLTDRPLLEER